MVADGLNVSETDAKFIVTEIKITIQTALLRDSGEKLAKLEEPVQPMRQDSPGEAFGAPWGASGPSPPPSGGCGAVLRVVCPSLRAPVAPLKLRMGTEGRFPSPS